MSTEVQLRPAEPDDRGYIESLLVRNELPIADLSKKLPCLYVCETETEQIGVGGLEQYNEAGLVRSVAIEESARGNGYGTIVCDKLLDRARSTGISTIYLLTTTSYLFFGRLGFYEVARETFPTSIQNTSEFSDLCPVTAVCMKRDLDESRVVSHDSTR
jgi:amino-acid N-acetyltransferase